MEKSQVEVLLVGQGNSGTEFEDRRLIKQLFLGDLV